METKNLPEFPQYSKLLGAYQREIIYREPGARAALAEIGHLAWEAPGEDQQKGHKKKHRKEESGGESPEGATDRQKIEDSVFSRWVL